MLTKNRFDMLSLIDEDGIGLSQRAISEETDKSVGTVNKTLKELKEEGYIDSSGITKLGYSALEPYRVKRAVFIAAGFGSRLVPITLNTPKPLVRVNGVRIIDTLLDAVYKAGINEVVIVRGYLAEQFDQLLYKYPNIRFAENPIYNESNNISSVMCVRHMLANSYVFESDLVLRNPRLITKYQYSSNYLGVSVDMTDDWCFETKNGYISKLKQGGTSCHHMFGVSYWNEEDGKKLAGHLEAVYNMPGGKERFWDQAPLDYFIDEYKISVRKCTFDDIIEIDSYSELKKLDHTYV